MVATAGRVSCGACGVSLDEDPSAHPDLRRPCSSCGSLLRKFNVQIEANAHSYIKLGIKVKPPGVPRPIIEQTVGDDLHRKTGRWMKLRRVVDRLTGWYSEAVTDPESGEVVHRCDEPLGDHRGHGADKKSQ